MVDWPWIIVWQLGFLILGIWLIWMLRQFQLPFKPLGHGLDWAVCAIALSLLVSNLFSPFPLVGAKYLSIAVGYGVLLYVARNWIDRSRFTWQRLWLGLSATGFIGTLVGLGKWWWWPGRNLDTLRNPFPLGHHNFVAGYLVLLIPLTIALALSRRGWQRWAGLGVNLILLLHLYTTASRGGMLGITVLAVVAVGFAIAETRGRLRTRLAIGLILGLIAMMTVIITSPRVEHLIQFGATELNPIPVQIQLDGNMKFRLFLWEGAWNIFQDKPVLGVGLGNMSRVYNLYRPIVSGTSGTYNVQQLHNTPLQLLGELGLLGWGAITIFALLVARLWFRLYQQPLPRNQRLLLYGIGGSLLGYGISSLTDYQLDNIAISATLLLLVILLLAIADDSPLPSPVPLKKSQRRIFSLAGISSITLACFFSLPLTVAMWLHHQAQDQFELGNNSQAIDHLITASAIVPWDPTYDLELGFRLLRARSHTEDPERSKELKAGATDFFENALAASPTDDIFLYHVGLLQRKENPEGAEAVLRKAVQIQFRAKSYTTYMYYILARADLENEQPPQDQAIAALALQGFNNPEFLLSAVWQESPLAQLKETVLEETLALHQTLLQKLPPDSSLSKRVREREILIRWWHRKPIAQGDINQLRPLPKALITAETSPQKALEIIKTALAKRPNNSHLLLLAAWLDPEQYLDPYFQSKPAVNLGKEEAVRTVIEEKRNLRDWLHAYQPILSANPKRIALSLAYRNYDIHSLSEVLQPQELKINPLVKAFRVFPAYPRSSLPLETFINEVRTERLGLPHPTHNQFQLVE